MKSSYDLVCFSHLRWDFVYQRPQHLLSRCAKTHRVYYVEEPIFDSAESRLEISSNSDDVTVVVPHLPSNLDQQDTEIVQRRLIGQLFDDNNIGSYVLWFYTPMALPICVGLEPLAIVYDCMDELSAFRGAPIEMTGRERELMAKADLVFTGGQSLFDAKKNQHRSVHAFPSSVDTIHFEIARQLQEDPQDQSNIPHPRIGFYGVIDERLDLDLISGVSDLRCDWQFVIIGPVVKIDPKSLPTNTNIHYLGSKSYSELPAYLAGWDVAMLPFARNESTKFISPTKTPEYLAGGKPVVSTSIRDVVRPYEELGLVRIADTPAAFVEAIEKSMAEDSTVRWKHTDKFLAETSWHKTWSRMDQLIDDVIASRQMAQKEECYV